MPDIDLTSTLAPSDPATVETLQQGELEVLGRIPWSSNGTFVVRVCAGEHRLTAIYKPERGERPLWDFPSGLWRRERAARVLDAQLGFSFVPPTEVRSDAPLGIGTCQYFVPSDPEVTAFDLMGDERHIPALARLAAFDVVANNTDRKAGHCLLGAGGQGSTDQGVDGQGVDGQGVDGQGVDGQVFAIDHGLCFHADEKIRTVLWDLAGIPLDPSLRLLLAGLSRDTLDDEFDELLDTDELDAMVGRAHDLAAIGELPSDPSGRRYPWPLV